MVSTVVINGLNSVGLRTARSCIAIGKTITMGKAKGVFFTRTGTIAKFSGKLFLA